MAENKASSNQALTLHVSVYGLVMFLGLSAVSILIPMNILNIAIYVVCNIIVHWCIDYVTSRMNHYFWKINQAYFWWSIGFDQFLHIAFLIFTLEILTCTMK